MFILYAVPIGVLLGLLLGGRLSGLAAIEFRWPQLAVAGLVVQLALFLPLVAASVGEAGAAVYVSSSVAVLVALLRNLRIRGLVLVAAGAVANLAAIVANGGYMPAAPSALAALGKSIGAAYSNSTVSADPALEPLTDIFAMPPGVPFANVFSIGDVLIALGIALAIILAMCQADAVPRPWPESSLAGSKGP